MSQNQLLRANLKSTEIEQLYQSQQDFCRGGQSYDLGFRISTLKKLRQLIQENEASLLEAMAEDFGKPAFEAFASEIGFVYAEIDHTLKNLKEWARPKRVHSPIATWPSRSYVVPQPKGICLIIAPWNYPFMLVFSPLIAALAAGNTAFVKPAEQCVATSNLICQILFENFDQELISVIQGPGDEVIPPLLKKHRFDHIFFTGSTAVGSSIAKLAAEKLSPCTLELGGKSPAIVEQTANLKVAAKRIAFGKWLNAGQTCVAPDYLLVQRSILDDFIKELRAALQEFYPDGALASPHYTSIVNEHHFKRLQSLLPDGELIFGGEMDTENRRMAPSLLLNPNLQSAIMQEEIFGPILPIIPFDSLEETRAIIDQNPNPLAFYLFTENKQAEDFWKTIPFGGGAVNNAIIHLANPDLPFGGIGTSGQGQYHGKFGFETFSHQKAIMKSGTWLDLKQKYPPYGDLAFRMVKWLMS